MHANYVGQCWVTSCRESEWLAIAKETTGMLEQLRVSWRRIRKEAGVVSVSARWLGRCFFAERPCVRCILMLVCEGCDGIGGDGVMVAHYSCSRCVMCDRGRGVVVSVVVVFFVCSCWDLRYRIVRRAGRDL